MSQIFKCRGCGEFDSIVEVGLVPRIVAVRPDGDGGTEYVDSDDEAFWEAETNIGYGCTNSDCEFWQGDGGIRSHNDVLSVVMAYELDEIAEAIEDTGVNPEAGNPAFYYPIQ